MVVMLYDGGMTTISNVNPGNREDRNHGRFHYDPATAGCTEWGEKGGWLPL